MGFDTELADRIRELLGPEPDLTERRMFGGLAFLVHGNMAVAASGRGGMMVRADPDAADTLIGSGEADAMDMRGRTMRGWVHIDPERLAADEQLARWVELGVGFARSLPPK